MVEITELVVGIAKSNPKWGYTRIRGALSNLGHTVARSTIANILREHGIEPAPERGERTPWRTFLTAHWETVAATDFFTVEVATFRRLVTYYVLVVIELSSRKVHVAGITPGPDSAFMMQVARNLTDPVDGFLLGKRFLILDRDKKFTAEFRASIEDAGTDVIRLPYRSPTLMKARIFISAPQCERVNGSTKTAPLQLDERQTLLETGEGSDRSHVIRPPEIVS